MMGSNITGQANCRPGSTLGQANTMAELSRKQRHKVRLALPRTKLPLLQYVAFEDLSDLQADETLDKDKKKV